ncbi:DUF3265 domain-containing protein [Vibrio vulnificus]|nr:DUF3265 domain-containing protein [Vibrio vulnificus]
MTRRSSGIHAAWHFWYAVGFCGESGVRKAGLGGIHPLTRRYVLSRKTTRSCRICVFIHWKSACLNLFNSKSGVLL